jgi:hypothetical protein
LESKSSLRNKYGKGFLSIVDNHTIKWNPLSIEDFFYYEALSSDPQNLSIVLEDEIFKKCVTDKYYLDNINILPAGLVSAVVQNIMEHSGPLSIDHFNDLLNQKRQEATQPLNHLATLIIRAFPGYVPEDIYAMSFDTFMLRLAQAESLLMTLKIISEPISLVDTTKQEEPKPKKNKLTKEQLQAILDKKNKPTEKPVVSPNVKKDNSHWEPATWGKPNTSAEKSPIFNKDTKHPKYKNLGDLNRDRISQEQAAGSADESAERAKMVKDAQVLYKDLIAKLPFYNKKK